MSSRWFEPPRPWHLVLAPAVPLLSLALANADLASPSAAFWPAAIGAAVACAAWLLLLPFAGDARACALAVTVVMLAALNHATIARAASSWPFSYPIPAVYLTVAGVATLMLRQRGRAAALTRMTNVAIALALGLLAVQVTWTEWRTPAVGVAALTAPPGDGPADRPDVLVVILDGYGRHDVLRARYGFDNDLVPALRTRGFAVPDQAASNYSQTAHSLASALNFDYLPGLLDETDTRATGRRALGRLIATNRLFTAFAAAGYRITTYESEYGLVRPGPSHERRGLAGSMNDFDYAAYEAAVVPALLQTAGLPRAWVPLQLHRRQVRWTLDQLRTSAAGSSDAPSLVFAHVLAPHPPFAFNADGTARPTALPALLQDGDHWQAMARGSGEEYEAGYVESVRFLNDRVLAVVEAVLDSARRPTIVYIQGDHGPGAGLQWERMDASDLRERHGILLAMRFPEGEPPLGPRTTPVNAFRALTNRALGTRLPHLPDRSYFATWRQPFEFVDVTERVQ